jgi:hypothetical protein
MKFTQVLPALALIAGLSAGMAAAEETYSWRYYRSSNTGIQGDYNEAVWIGPDGDPYVGGYEPSFEEGGFAKFVQAENRWINYSNVDYPVIGHPDLTGCARVSDIVADDAGKLWRDGARRPPVRSRGRRLLDHQLRTAQLTAPGRIGSRPAARRLSVGCCSCTRGGCQSSHRYSGPLDRHVEDRNPRHEVAVAGSPDRGRRKGTEAEAG